MKKIFIILVILILILPFCATTLSYAYDTLKGEENQAENEQQEVDKQETNEEIEKETTEEPKTEEPEEIEIEEKEENNKPEETEEVQENENQTFITSMQSDEIEEGTYYISSAIDETRIFDIEGTSKSNGSRLQLWGKSGQTTDNQRFIIKKTEEGYYTIEAKHSGKVLDVPGASTANGTKVQQYESNNSDAQKWILKETEDGYYYIMSKCNGLYIDVPGANPKEGAQLQVYEGNGTNSQKFKLQKIEEIVREKTIEDGTYKIRTASNEAIVLDVDGLSRENGANIQLWGESSLITRNQRFEVKYIEDGYYEITAKHSGKALDVVGAGKSNGTNVQQYESNHTDAQQWIIKDNNDGTYSIISKSNELYLDVKGGQIGDGGNIQVYEGNGTIAQKFKFEKLEKETCEQTIENGIYKISSALNNNMMLDIDGGSYNNSANLQIWGRGTVQQQKFEVTYQEDGYYEIKSVNSGKVLDVSGGSNANGANVRQYQANQTEYQKWILKDAGNGYYYIISRGAEAYLDVAGASSRDGANIQIYDGNGTNSQKFKFEKTQIINENEYNILTGVDSSKVLDVDLGSSNVQIWTINQVSGNQKFELKYLGNQCYKIICKATKEVLTVDGSNVIQDTDIGSSDQKWQIEVAGNGYYYIKSESTGLYLDILGASTAEGSNIQVYAGNKTKAQMFKFQEIYTFYGIDVSEWNQIIDWAQVKNSGEVDFAMIRAGYRGYGTGKLMTDMQFLKNVTGATANGIEIGLYFFTQAVNVGEAIEEANYVLNLIRQYNLKITYPIAIDSEYSGATNNSGRADKLDAATRTAICKAFCDTIRNAGYIPSVYASRDWLYYNLNVNELNNCDIWVAHYTNNLSNPTNYMYSYTMWQYTSSGTVPGVYAPVENGRVRVDKNVAYKKY